MACFLAAGATIDSSGYYAAWLRIYAADGSVVWTQIEDGGGFLGVAIYSVATDSANNVIVAGHVYDVPDGLNRDIWVRKYDPSGNEVWTRTHDTGGADFANGVVVDSSGDATVVGSTQIGANTDLWIRKYSH